ncbi:glycosyltransferase [Christiangramia echinicola]|uniref:glycosyltransferase n=1 Tax=Christiangramia echinicola TaxID=279359 RepID=UPI00041B3172|nr:glycosyltransferase [Christiangramia echinicola]
MPNIAIISPSQNTYSETFIQAHKSHLKGKIFSYSGRPSSLFLEGFGSLDKANRKHIFKFKRFFLNKTYTWYYQQFLKQSFVKNKVEIVLAEYGTTAKTYLPVIKDLKLPLIVHFHGYDASRKDILKKNDNYRMVFEYARYIIVVSKKMYDDLLRLGCPESKLIYNVYGPNDRFLSVDPHFNNPQFFAMGRFVDKKAPYLTILAFEQIYKEFPEARLLMAGDGYLLNTCKQLVKYYNLQERVEFLGVISRESFIEYLEKSIAFVQHSITADNGDSEGTPVAILEASAAGIPIISTYHAGIPDVITNGVNGFLVEELNVNEMANSMRKLLESRTLAKMMGKEGRINIKKNFTLNRHIEILQNLIQECVN